MRKISVTIFILAGALVAALLAGASEINYTDTMLQEGEKLAAELRNLAPASETSLRGTLKRKESDGSVKSLILISKIIPQNDKWVNIYETVNPENSAYEQLAIIHSPGKKNRYIYTTGNGKDETPDLSKPFAGSDFSIGELGLEFFHWQIQYLIRSEMRKSRFCRVLESRPKAGDSPLGYNRVLSWIDKETGGILIAEAYDNNKKVKTFEVNSFRKDESGNWQIEEIEIRNLISKTKTQLIFQSSQKE
ncbi:MAG: outer membrane lipoprotein-sorting protein [Verrucomicrobiia bacterium]